MEAATETSLAHHLACLAKRRLDEFVNIKPLSLNEFLFCSHLLQSAVRNLQISEHYLKNPKKLEAYLKPGWHNAQIDWTEREFMPDFNVRFP